MKFDMSKAWNDATDMLGANREVILALSGVFFFLPGFASSLLMHTVEPPVGADQAALRGYLLELYKDNAPVIVVSAVVQLVGAITLLALLRDDSKPTVGEALRTGLVGLLPYIGVYLLLVIGAFVAVLVLVGIPSALGLTVLAIVLMVLAVPLLVYVGIKLSLVTPVIAIEKLMNPIAIIRRSWALTKGNSLRLLLFYFLLGLVYVVASVVVGAVVGLGLTLLGDGTVFQVGNGILTGLVGAAGTMVFTVVIAAVHRQLAGPSAGNISQTFG
ncbi:MAG: hypothetical protein H6R45_697 [Proteobacteria bacterium]|nr:hypothetical protein [Pseudomonadota bacterium]